MGWPEDGKLVVKSLAKKSPDFKKSISSVYLLGYGKIKARQTVEGLEVQLPSPSSSAQMAACQSKNKIAPVLRIAK